MELEQQKMELDRRLEQQKDGLEKLKAKDETERRLRAMTDEVEQCELQAHLIEEEENGEIRRISISFAGEGHQPLTAVTMQMENTQKKDHQHRAGTADHTTLAAWLTG